MRCLYIATILTFGLLVPAYALNTVQTCDKIVRICKAAGYVKGGHKNIPKRRLWVDCVNPISENKKVPNVIVPSDIDRKDCADKISKSDLINQKCGEIVNACKAAGYDTGGRMTDRKKRLWMDCVIPISRGQTIPNVNVPGSADKKGCVEVIEKGVKSKAS